MDTSISSDCNKKIALEELSKEDLIKKCKGLLTIAQKAKQAKDILKEENNVLKSKIDASSKSQEDASTEIIENLTQQKLAYVTTIEDLKKQNTALTNKLQTCLQDLCLSEEKNNTLDNENVSLKRQTKRLTEENEQLITDLDSMEKQLQECKRLGLEQQNQLLAIEESKSKAENSETVELQNMLAVSLDEVKKLKQERDAYSEKIENLKINLAEKDKNILVISEEFQKQSNLIADLEKQLQANNSEEIQTIKSDYEKLKVQNSDLNEANLSMRGDIDENIRELNELRQTLQEINDTTLIQLNTTVEKLKEKVKLYHSKIVKFAGNVKVLKENKNEILSLFKIYTEQVENWKSQLIVSSQKLIVYIRSMEIENADLLNENKTLKESNEKFIKLLEAHKTDDEKSKDIAELEALKIDNKRLTEEINLLLSVQEEFKSQIEVLTAETASQSSEMVELLERHHKELQTFDDQSKRDTQEIQSRIEENEKICLEYRKIISKLEEDVNSNLREIDELKLKNSILQEECDHSKSTEKQFAEKTSEEILKLVQENTQLAEENRKLQETTKHKCENGTQTEDSEDLELATGLKRENSELLTEMNEMNQALKERGETISKLQAHCEEIMKKMQVYESQANKNVDNITQKEEEIKNLQRQLELAKSGSNNNVNSNESNDSDAKNEEINQLKSELEQLKERFNSNMDTSYAESETMSTSTISRSEEVNRLKDLEGSWEERYGKLRNLALKLKGKIRDLTTELTREQNEKNDAHQKYSTSIKTISTLQAQCDKLQDELELSRKQAKESLSKLDQVAVDISNDKQKLVQDEDVITRLRKELEEFKQEKNNTDNWKKQISAKVQTFRKELEANKVLKKEFESQIAKLTADLQEKEQALKQELENHQQTRNSLEQSNNERKKTSVLNLEMQDYERSVKELSQQLEKKQEQINKLKNQLESQKSTVNAIREQNKLQEDKVQALESDLNSTKSEIAAYKKQISEYEDVIAQKESKIQHLTHLNETTRSENEELSTELSKVIAEHQRVNSSLKNEKEHFRSQTLGLQQSLRETQDTLELKEAELSAIKNDYTSYKVRAQSVLRQNQNRDVGLDEKLAEELSSFKLRCENLNSELKESKAAIEKLKEENGRLLDEKNEISVKFQESTSEAEDLKSLYDQLASKHQQTVIEHGESVRSLKVHAETLSQCYRQQLSEQEVRHNREIIEMQSKMEKAPTPTELPFPPLPTMHREEGEGSESTDSVQKTVMHPVPLERLLGSDTDQEVAFIRKQLAEEEMKVIHLTALLADTEQDLAKHTQMNKVLKEEIRRQQRSVEREKHAENLEYLKNVVFKFVTLHSGDERSRLVPVLNTILKLSPEETQKLIMVAKGDPGLRGWSNYLWSPAKP